jgi:hypothetical protein
MWIYKKGIVDREDDAKPSLPDFQANPDVESQLKLFSGG